MGDEKRDEPTGYQESHHLQCLKLFFVLFCFNLFLNEGQLLYNVLLVSAVERESAMSIHLSPSS